MLKRNKTTSPRKVSKNATNKNTFLSYKRKGQPGMWQTPQFIIKTKVKNIKEKTHFTITGFLGNGYDLGLITTVMDTKTNKEIPNSNSKLVVFQDENGTLYLTEHKHGIKLRATYTWGKLSLTTLAHYMFVVKDVFDETVNNEYLFDIATDKTMFVATGEGVEGNSFQGWKLTFQKSLISYENNEQIDFEMKENPNQTKIEFEEIEDLV